MLSPSMIGALLVAPLMLRASQYFFDRIIIQDQISRKGPMWVKRTSNRIRYEEIKRSKPTLFRLAIINQLLLIGSFVVFGLTLAMLGISLLTS